MQGCSARSRLDKHLSSVARTVTGTTFAAQLRHSPGAPGASHDMEYWERRMVACRDHTALHRPVNITCTHVAATRRDVVIGPRGHILVIHAAWHCMHGA